MLEDFRALTNNFQEGFGIFSKQYKAVSGVGARSRDVISLVLLLWFEDGTEMVLIAVRLFLWRSYSILYAPRVKSIPRLGP
jgi:hypothetical protein